MCPPSFCKKTRKKTMSFGQNDRSKIKKSPLSIKLRGEKTAKKETNKW